MYIFVRKLTTSMYMYMYIIIEYIDELMESQFY